MAEDGRLVKQEEDCTALVDEALPQAIAIASVRAVMCMAVTPCVMMIEWFKRSLRCVAPRVRADDTGGLPWYVHDWCWCDRPMAPCVSHVGCVAPRKMNELR